MERVMDASRERNAREQKKRASGGSIRFYKDGVIWKNLIVIYVAWFSTLMVHFGLIRELPYMTSTKCFDFEPPLSTFPTDLHYSNAG